jgi:CDGSH-type Zn-finger protein
VTDPERTARPAATITPYRDGPYLIRGDFELLDGEGRPLPLGRRTIALCRCGRSQTRPFCDGTHKLTGFRAAADIESALVAPPPENVQMAGVPLIEEED